MNKEGGSTLTIRKSNHVTDGFKGYKATLFAGEMSYTEINIPLRKGDDLFLHGNKDAGCIGYFSGSEVLLFSPTNSVALYPLKPSVTRLDLRIVSVEPPSLFIQ